MKPKNPSTSRVAAMRKRNREDGQVRRDYSATPSEHDILKQTLRAMRNARK